MASFLLTHFFTSSHASLLAKITSNKELNFFTEAILDVNWINAMNKELDALESNKT